MWVSSVVGKDALGLSLPSAPPLDNGVPRAIPG